MCVIPSILTLKLKVINCRPLNNKLECMGPSGEKLEIKYRGFVKICLLAL